MTTRSTFAKASLAAVAGLMALSATAASAQPYGAYDNGGAYYDPCKRDSSNRGIVGALIGGALGASVGANAAARNARQDGALLGGALGAVAGATIGKNGAGCTPGQARTPYQAGYAPRAPQYAPPPPQYGYNDQAQPYDSRYAYAERYDDRYDDRDAYDDRAQPYPAAAGQPTADGCTLAESPIHLPDGRIQKRFVRVCMDADGRYQVVD